MILGGISYWEVGPTASSGVLIHSKPTLDAERERLPLADVEGIGPGVGAAARGTAALAGFGSLSLSLSLARRPLLGFSVVPSALTTVPPLRPGVPAGVPPSPSVAGVASELKVGAAALRGRRLSPFSPGSCDSSLSFSAFPSSDTRALDRILPRPPLLRFLGCFLSFALRLSSSFSFLR